MALFWNEAEGRLRAGWRLLLQFLLMVALSVLVGAALYGLPGTPAKTAVISLLALGGSVLLAGRWLDRRPLRSGFGLQLGAAWWADLAFGLVLGVVLMAAVFEAERRLGWIAVSLSGTLMGAGYGRALAEAAFVFVAVGLYEELWSRAYHLTNLAEGLRGLLGARGAVVGGWMLSSLLFGLLHVFNPNASAMSTLNIMAAGLLLGLGYVLTRRLALPIGLHITWNFAQGVLFGFPVSGSEAFSQARVFNVDQGGPPLWTGGAFGPEAGLVGLLAMLLGIFAILVWVRYRAGALRLRLDLAAPPPHHDAPPAQLLPTQPD